MLPHDIKRGGMERADRVWSDTNLILRHQVDIMYGSFFKRAKVMIFWPLAFIFSGQADVYHFFIYRCRYALKPGCQIKAKTRLVVFVPSQHIEIERAADLSAGAWRAGRA